ncbi:cytochrome P450 [Lentithecium fluviatile CBS 122367]|uniref:Cytochrome P450 n=1 Tax=Lentithecium fluviatile CBS 122367 TaxID=1168545 RepID=A0A6G1IE47_9PLEO|nr:cytochrome P450 [Lentithecium fluviatile CBS 122367]
MVVLCALLQALYTRYHGGLNAIPGPFTASFCNYWKVMSVYKSDMPQRNMAVHRKYGPVVRIGPNHVSFASPEALVTIHGSRQAFPKSDFYKQTVATWEGKPLLNLFSVQDVNWHSSLKKTIGGLYTKSAVLNLEPKIDTCLQLFTKKMKELTRSGNSTVDMSLWVHLFTFDCLGDINVSRNFGFMESGKDVNGMIAGSDSLLIMTGLYAQAPFLQVVQRVMEAIWGMRKVNPILKLTSSLVNERLEKPTQSRDMLNNFTNLRQANPDKLSSRKIIGSLYINLMAGHDVLAVTLRAILYYVARTPRVEEKLRAELATVHSKHAIGQAVPYGELSKLPVLDAVIQESLRIHGNLGLINERVVPREGAVINGFKLPGGTVVGVNPWAIHHNTEIFGEDVDVFRPERWLDSPEDRLELMRRNLFSFGAGPRKCIGMNIAMMQICKFISEFYRHFDARLAHPEKEWQVVGNWVTKQTEMDMLITTKAGT